MWDSALRVVLTSSTLAFLRFASGGVGACDITCARVFAPGGVALEDDAVHMVRTSCLSSNDANFMNEPHADVVVRCRIIVIVVTITYNNAFFHYCSFLWIHRDRLFGESIVWC